MKNPNIKTLKDQRQSNLSKRTPKKYKFTSEQLLNSKDKEQEFSPFGLMLWDYYDKLRFTNLPSMTIEEITSSAYRDGLGQEMASLEFSFNNLEESLGTVSRIIVYYDTVSINSTPPSVDNIDMDDLQRKQVLLDVPVLSIKDSLKITRFVPVTKKPTMYLNVFAVYLDISGKPAELKGHPIINYAIKFPVYGLTVVSNFIECKNLVIDELSSLSDIDLDGQGYSGIVTLPSRSVNLRWYDFSDINSQEEWDEVIGEKLLINDTYSNKRWFGYPHLSKILYSALYMFIPSGSKGPSVRYPQQVDVAKSFVPSVEDLNGRWVYVGTYYDNTASIILEPKQITAFWVGYKLGK